MKKFLQTIGLDPLVAFTVVAIDFMLFAPDPEPQNVRKKSHPVPPGKGTYG